LLAVRNANPDELTQKTAGKKSSRDVKNAIDRVPGVSGAGRCVGDGAWRKRRVLAGDRP
jgi:hypothetical protein